MERGADFFIACARGIRGVVADSAALGGAVEIVNLQAVAIEHFAFQNQGQGGARGNGQFDGRRNGRSIAPHPPERGDAGKSQTLELAASLADSLGQARGGEDQRHAMQQKG